jgi:DNA ligase-1
MCFAGRRHTLVNTGLTGMIMVRILLRFSFWLHAFFLLQFSLISFAVCAAPPLMLANNYRPGMPLDDYWVSEKLDGVRAYWDGKKLYTRAGNLIHTPAWFTKDWPIFPMDGELWAGRGKFDQTSATVRQLVPDDKSWQSIRFMVFDLPEEPGVFTHRLSVLQKNFTGLKSHPLKMIPQARIATHQKLMEKLDAIVKEGGEGLMLHRGQSLYLAGRSSDLLKVKPYDDAEAKVIAYIPGKRKYAGMMGALLVETPEGVRFKIGTGFTDEQRRNPPAIGANVTYRYRGFHASGIPRFASFMRVRE